MKEVDDVCKSGSRYVVEEGSNALLHVVGEMPDDESHSETVLIAGIVEDVSETWKVGVFASTIHTYSLESLHGWCVGNALHEGGYVGVIDGEKHEERGNIE